MIKALLDEKDLSPSQIADDLTIYNNFGRNDTTVGYIDNVPVYFTSTDNVMSLQFFGEDDKTKVIDDVQKYAKDIRQSNEGLIVKVEEGEKEIKLKFWWRDE